ncbi:MAG TPA: UDP-N-acetylmuramoyl-L-alanine--D-glutamate ligase, partial [Myxococcota bacterium]|nr:UDP-N-acetylmuramoyl-L-alanine--D-glutamate ligase [Myxococcota bacterium]
MSINFLSKQVVVFGAGRSGLAATNLLLQYGAEVILTDDAPFEQLLLLNAFNKKDHAKLTLKLGGGRPIISRDSCAALILSPG